MSITPIDHSEDLQRLQSEGYEISIAGAYLVLKSVPYVTQDQSIKRGNLVTDLTLQGDRTVKPSNHWTYFSGEMPHNLQGRPVSDGISPHGPDLGSGIKVDYLISRKPPEGGYENYYQKMTTYVNLISAPAERLDRAATAKTFAVVESHDEESVFQYLDTASSRAGIGHITEKLQIASVAIVGLGGTGSYILDLVAKTPVREIHLFDEDPFGQHNAFRAPGAPSIETLKEAPQKAKYFQTIYSEMHKHIFAHDNVDESTIHLLKGMSFVFVAVDHGPTRKLIAEKLEEFDVPFIDVGMELGQENNSINGQLRITSSTNLCRQEARARIPMATINQDDLYSNVQVADLNALNATLAVVRWKKLHEFYTDQRGEYSATYVIGRNGLTYLPRENVG